MSIQKFFIFCVHPLLLRLCNRVHFYKHVDFMIADLAETPEGSDAAENPIWLHLMCTPIKPNLVKASPLGKQGQKGAINKINSIHHY